MLYNTYRVDHVYFKITKYLTADRKKELYMEIDNKVLALNYFYLLIYLFLEF